MIFEQDAVIGLPFTPETTLLQTGNYRELLARGSFYQSPEVTLIRRGPRLFCMDAGFWNERYADGLRVYGEAPNAFLAEACAQIPAGPVLCLAEGEGRNAVYLAQGGHHVTAVDLSAVGLDKAARLATKCGVEIATVHADLADDAIERGAWTGIVAIFAHVPPPLRQRLHREAVAQRKSVLHV